MLHEEGWLASPRPPPSSGSSVDSPYSLTPPSEWSGVSYKTKPSDEEASAGWMISLLTVAACNPCTCWTIILGAQTCFFWKLAAGIQDSERVVGIFLLQETYTPFPHPRPTEIYSCSFIY